MPDRFRKISDVINEEKDFEKIKTAAENFDVVEKFAEIFPELKKVTEAVKINNNMLFLRVENSVWRSELNFKQKILVEKINNYFGKKVIKAIKFVS
jgi:hypothetical protein